MTSRPDWTVVEDDIRHATASDGRDEQRPRILIVVHGYPPTYTAGAERRAERTARGLTRRGFDVAVLCVESLTSCAGPCWKDDRQDGVLVRRVDLGAEGTSQPYQWSYENPTIATALADLIEAWQPQIVHQFSGYITSASTISAAKQYDLPVVVSLTDYWWLCHQVTLTTTRGTRCDGPSVMKCTRCHAEQYRRYRLPARKWPTIVDRLWQMIETTPSARDLLGRQEQRRRHDTLLSVLGEADALIAPSHYLAEMYFRYGVDAGKMRIWRQGVDLTGVLPHRPDETYRVGYIGQVKPHKGVDVLLDAWHRMVGSRQRRLTICGSDRGAEAYGDMLRARLATLPHASWPGEIARTELWSFLADLDVLVVPSRWVENSPNSILEARAAGVVVVASSLGALPELVTHETDGLLFRVDDASDLARQLQRLMDAPEHLERLRGRIARVRTLNDEIEQIAQLYAELRDSCSLSPKA